MAKLGAVDFVNARERLLNRLDEAVNCFDAENTFTGPSLYFHLTSLDAARQKDINRFAEQVYALLPSWGMHRMGPKGPKMVDFHVFKTSLFSLQDDLAVLAEKKPEQMAVPDWERLEKVFRSLICMRTNVQLVANSKVLAHWLPNLIPPIDREYTLSFLPYRGDISGLNNGWLTLRALLTNFFYPILNEPAFLQFADAKLASAPESSWHTSRLKILDNSLIGFNAPAPGERSEEE